MNDRGKSDGATSHLGNKQGMGKNITVSIFLSTLKEKILLDFFNLLHVMVPQWMRRMFFIMRSR